MGAATHRLAQTKGGEPVSTPIDAATSRHRDTLDGPVAVFSAKRVSVVEGYQRWAAIYDQAPNPMLTLEQRQVTSLLPEIAGKHVLDLACGTGRWTRILAARNPVAIVGVDLSAAMLRVAETNSATQQLLQADCCQLPFAANTFDFAICSFALSHVTNLNQLARECARVLRSNAALFITDMHPKAYAAGWRTRFRDSCGAVEISTMAHPCNQIVRHFCSAGLECTATNEFAFAEPERPIFARAGKLGLFAEACRIPAVLLCRFGRVN